ncbi:MBL fold metallo-hydrolase [Halocatena halophila]|uniref:MBL fold metallo-hydrolase n=1 Tax=Halocatena halophila TaxID=2814576 RepID=UPI002ED66E0D
MKLRYQHANPFSGRESVLLRISGVFEDQTICILIDAGEGVNVDELLREDEYLTAICLTHAHYDHYRSLAENLRHGASVYMTAETKELLSAVYDSVPPERGEKETVLSNTRIIDGWTSIVQGVSIRALPAGHAPGASSLMLAIDDGTTQRTVLATGDFTRRQAAGYPGFDPELPVDVDVCLLSASANETFEEDLTGVIERSIERALDGSTVLVTASGQVGLQFGYLLGHTIDEQELTTTVTLAGESAKLAERLDYSIPHCTTTAAFEPDQVLESGSITVANPGTPAKNPAAGAGQLFEQIRDDPGATLIQVPTDGPPVDGAGCTIHTERVQNHPTPETIDAVVRSLEPIHLVVLHETGPNADRYKDRYHSYVWVTADRLEHTLLEDGVWTPPGWVSEHTEEMVHTWRITGRDAHRTVTDPELDFPTIERQKSPDLSAEGLTLGAFDVRPERSELEGGKYPLAPASSTEQSQTEPNQPDAIESLTERIERLENTIQNTILESNRQTGRVLDVTDGVTIVRVDGTFPEITAGDHVAVSNPDEL